MLRRSFWFCVVSAAVVCTAAAQSVPAVGTAQTFDAATWNVEWFGAANGPLDDERQLDNVEAVIEKADIDLWALQEVASVAHFERLLDSLGTAYAGLYRDNTSSGVTQRLAFVYKTDVVRVRGVEQMLTPQYDYEFAWRPPLKLDLDVTLPDTTVALTVITLHMKAMDDAPSYERRRQAAVRLKNRLDVFYPTARVIVLGDFNDELGHSITSGRTTPYEVFLDDPGAYRFLTLPFDQANLPTYCRSSSCGFGSTLDHILVTNELFDAYTEDGVGRFTELIGAIPGYTDNTSDHLPVYARFSFASSTTAIGENGPPAAFSVRDVYPNPFRDGATLRFTTDQPGPVRIELFDLLGRRVVVAADGYRAAGAHEASIDASKLPEGVYFVRVQAGGRSATRRVVRLR